MLNRQSGTQAEVVSGFNYNSYTKKESIRNRNGDENDFLHMS